MSSTNAQLDHVVILLPYHDIVEPPAWITKHFTVSPGGRHGDNKTENRIVYFRDGSYLELIAFINDDAEKRKGHWWDKPYGVVDYALTSAASLDHEAINRRLEDAGSHVRYQEPQAGSRRTEDGRELEWKVTSPGGIKRGVVPFWCHDVSPRAWRVPLAEHNEAGTTHPCGAQGVGEVVLHVQDARLESLNDAMYAILGIRPSEGTGRYKHSVGQAQEVSSLRRPMIRLDRSGGRMEGAFFLSLMLQSSLATRSAIEQHVGNEHSGGKLVVSFTTL